jgi:glutamine amidotransferase
MITIVDYGLGNLGSVFNMLKKLGIASIITSEPSEVVQARKLILPGVGHFDKAMANMNGSPLRTILDQKAIEERIPILGICLGMQLLTQGSEEGNYPGLGWIPAYTRKFRFAEHTQLKVPHMGWNIVHKSIPSPLTEGFIGEFRFYFVHSYYVHVEDEQNSILKAHHGIEFDAGIQQGNIFGVQFHPERSHRFGMKLLENFARI